MGLLDKLKKIKYVADNFVENGNFNEKKTNKWLGDAKGQAAEISGKMNQEGKIKETGFNSSDQMRHTYASQFTTENLRDKMPFGIGNSFLGRTAAAIGANVLGIGHEIKAGGWNEESLEDVANNFRGSLVGATGGTKSYDPGVVGKFGLETESKNTKKNRYNEKVSSMFPDGEGEEDTNKYEKMNQTIGYGEKGDQVKGTKIKVEGKIQPIPEMPLPSERKTALNMLGVSKR